MNYCVHEIIAALEKNGHARFASVQKKGQKEMTKTIVTPIFAAMILAVSACVVNAQAGSSCNSCDTGYPSYQQFCQTNYGSCVGPNVFGDKMVRPFNHCMTPCCDPCSLCCGGGYLSRLFGRSVQCAGPDFGYTYTPGLGANGQGIAPGWGYNYRQGSSGIPSYTYRSPRDFLNPNPPSIGY